ncbi:MAG TPA: hypothetical protein VJQ84_02555 [Solirubrobacterales bacterium]|nr:hypothetical protein [Solirubrobacterales bacterium]
MLAFAAQAHAAEWVIGGTSLSKLAKSEKVSGSGPMVINASGLLVECKTTSTGSILEGGTAELSVEFLNCHTPKEICRFKTFTAATKLTLSGTYVSMTPASGTTFATLTQKEPEEELCGLPPGGWPLTGSAAAETEEPGLEFSTYPFKFSPAIDGLRGAGMNLFSGSAHFEGTLGLSLAGAHAGSKWAPQYVETAKLCKSNGATCEPYPLGTAISGKLEEGVKFSFSYEEEKLEPSCLVSAMKGVSSHLGLPQIGEISKIEFSECGGGLCSVSSSGVSTFEAKGTGGGNGTIDLLKGITFSIKCVGMKQACTYSPTSAHFIVTGGTPARMSSGPVSMTQVGGGTVCGGASPKWEGVVAAGGNIKYELTAPSPLFIRNL